MSNNGDFGLDGVGYMETRCHVRIDSNEFDSSRVPLLYES